MMFDFLTVVFNDIRALLLWRILREQVTDHRDDPDRVVIALDPEKMWDFRALEGETVRDIESAFDPLDLKAAAVTWERDDE